jgi:hypothetical protein
MSEPGFWIFRLTYASEGGESSQWIPELVRLDDAQAKAVVLAAMPGTIRVERFASTDSIVPSSVHAEAVLRRQRDLAIENAQLDLLGVRVVVRG